MADNEDLAILGFQVQTKGADEAFEKIKDGLKGIDNAVKDTDALLEAKVTKALKGMAEAAASLGDPTAIRGIEATANALENIVNMSLRLNQMKDVANTISLAVDAMKSTGLERILESYASSMKGVANIFSFTNEHIARGSKGLQDALDMQTNTEKFKQITASLKELQTAYDQLSSYGDEALNKKLPKNVDRADVEKAAGALKTLIGYVNSYQMALNAMDQPDAYAKTVEYTTNLYNAIHNMKGAMKDVPQFMDNIMPGGIQTIQLKAKLTGIDAIKAQLGGETAIEVIVSEKDKQRFNDIAKSLEKLQKPVKLSLDEESANTVQNKLSKIVPSFEVSSLSIQSLQTQLNKATENMSVEVKIVPRVTGDDEAIAQMQKQAAERARDALNAMGIDVHGKKSIEDAIKGDYYGLVNVGRDLEQLYGGDKVNGILGDLFPKQGATSAQMFKSFTESLGDVRREMEGLLAFKATLDTSEFDNALETFKNTLTSVFTPESKQKFTNALVEDLKKTVLKPASITVSPQKIFVDRSDAIMEFVQKTLAMPIDDMMVSPTTIWVDRSNAEIRLLQVQLVADWQDVIVHPENLLLDIASVPTEKITALGDSANAISITVKRIVANPLSAKINLASIPKDALKVTGGSISIAPESITLDIPEAIRNNGILRLEKPLGVQADVVVKPIALNLPEGYIGKLDKPISVKSTIKIDPLPGDEITKMNELVTQIENVNNAYKPFSETLDHIKNTLTQINTLMSEEVKMVIRGAAKKGVTDADAIAKKTKQDLANQAKIDALKTAREHELNKTRRQLANEEWELRKDLQENYSGGLKYDETIALQRDLTAAYTEGEQKIQDARTRGAFVMNFAKDRADKLTQSVRENVAQTMEQAKSLARATADASRHSKALRDVSLAMQDYGRVQKVNMIDPLARLKAELGDTNSRLVDLGRTFGIYMSGRTIVNYFRQASESANNFALEIRRIQSLATDFDFGALRDGLLDIDARFGNVHHNAQALYWAYSSGVRGSEEDLVKFTEHMSKLSTTIKSDIMPTIDAATSIMNAFNLSASSAAEIGDTLLGIVKFGKSNAQQLTTSLGHVVAPAAALNVSLDELGATAATLTRTMKTNRAFTYLSNILGKMASPTKAVQEAAAELGVELSANAIKAKGFANVMREIRQATNGDVAKIAKLFPDLRGQRAAITLLSTQFGDFEQQLENFKHKTGSMEEALGKISDTPEAQIKALKNTMGMLALEVGNTTNNLLTLGGALGPVLEKFNAMGHVGRAITGNLVASVGAWGGYLVAAKAAQAAQYAILQATYQQASASMDIRRNELDIALTKERQALENNKIALSEMKAQIAADQYNDETLRTLRAQEDTLKKVIGDRKQEIVIMKQALNLQDKAMKPRLANMAALVGERSGTVHGLKSILADLQGDDRALRTTTTATLIGRMQATISQSMAKIQGENQTMANIMGREFQHLVETAPELQEALRSAIQKGSFEVFESAKEELQTIVGIIKNSTVIQSQLSQNDRGEDLLDLMVQQNILAGMKKQLVSGEAFQHEWVVKLVKQELNIAQSQLESERLKYDQTLKNVKAGTADLEQLEAIEKKVAERVAYETELRDIVNSIDEREGQLVGRRKEYAAILSENVKLMKAWLDADTTDSANIKANLDLALKNAAMLGKGTLNAVKAAYDAEMQHQSVLMDQRSVLTEIMSITDENGKLLSNDEKTQERYNKLLAQQKDLLEKAEDSRQRFVELGLKAGNQDAMRMFLKDWNGRIDLGKIVDKTMMDRAVIRESIRAMSRDIGGRFEAVNGMMRTASIMGSFVPGMGKLAMPMGLLSSFNVVGKAAGGMANLTASMMNLLGTTDTLKKQGILALNANVASFTRTLLLSGAWTKKMALAEKKLMAMRMKGMSANALAGASVKATWWTAGLGIAGILAGAITTWFVLNSTKKGGPLGDLAEKIYGIDDKNAYGDVLKQRLEQVKLERNINAQMKQELNSLVALREHEMLQNSIVLDLSKKSNDTQENINRQKARALSLQTEYNKLQEGIGNLQFIGEYQRLRKQLQDQMKQQIEEQKANKVKRIGIFAPTISDSPRLLTRKEIERMVENLDEIEEQERQTQQEIDKLTSAQDKAFDQMIRGIAEFRYQSLIKQLETSRDSAFTAAKDAADKQRSAERLLLLTRKRIEGILSNDKETVQLIGMSSGEIRKIIDNRITELSNLNEKAQKSLADAKDQLQGKQPNTKQQKNIEELEKAANEAEKNLRYFESNVQNAFNDYYQNIFATATATVNAIIEQSQKEIIGDAKKGEFLKSDKELLRTLPQANNILKEGIAKIEKDYKEGLGIFGDVQDETERLRLKDDLVKKAKEAVEKNSLTYIATTWSKLNQDVADILSNAEANNLFSNFDNNLKQQQIVIDKYHEFRSRVLHEYEEGIGMFADKDQTQRNILKENLLKKVNATLDKQSLSYISTTWSKLTQDVNDLLANSDSGNLFSNFDKSIDRQKMVVEKYREFIDRINQEYQSGIGMFADRTPEQREILRKNLLKQTNDILDTKTLSLIQTTWGKVNDDVAKLTKNSDSGNLFSNYENALAKTSESIRKYRDFAEQVNKDFAEGAGLFQDIKDEAQRVIVKENLDRLIQDALDTKTLSLIQTTWGKVNDDVEKMKTNADYQNLFNNYDNSLDTTRDIITRYRNFIGLVQYEYEHNLGMFAEISKQADKDRAKENLIKMAADKIRQSNTSIIQGIKSVRDSMSSFIDSVAGELISTQKELFESRLNSPKYAGMRNQLIAGRMRQLNMLLYGQNGRGGVLGQRAQAFDLANMRGLMQDYPGMQKALEDAARYSKEAKGYEMEKFELLKRQAEIEKSINADMYALANTLRGQFAATSQTAIEVSSLEGIRLTSRRLGENIAPPTSTIMQDRMQEFFEKASAQWAERDADLMKFSSEFYGEIDAFIKKNQTAFEESSKRLDQASITMDGAVNKFAAAINSPKPVINVKRI